MSRMEQMLEAVIQQQSLHQQQQQQFQQQQQEQMLRQQQHQAQLQQERAGAAQSNVFKRIAAMNPRTYEGQMDPEILENWIRDMEKLLEAVNCPADQRVSIAVYYLREAADHWWTSAKATLLAQEGFGWEGLKSKLRSQFYPYSVQEEKYNQFMQLRQRELTPLDYAKRFQELERFAPELVATEERRASKFINGLNFELREMMEVVRFNTLEEAVDRANSLYGVQKKREQFQNRCRKRSKGSSGSNGHDRKRFKANSGENNARGQTGDGRGQNYLCPRCGTSHPRRKCSGQPVTCFKCGRPGHTRQECRAGNLACFKCGKEGHIASQCRIFVE